MPTAKAHRQNLVHVDSKGRVVLPKEARRSGLYAVEVTDNDEIILRPRVAVDPREVISRRTLAVLDDSMRSLVDGKAGEPVDLSGFGKESETGEPEAKTKKNKPKHR